MDEHDQKCFYRRAKNDLVDQEIGARIKRQTSEFGQLVMNVFRHMGASYQPPDENDPIYDLRSISYNFYKKFYIEPKITLFGEKDLIPTQSFVDDALLDLSNGHRNKFSFLIGQVGVGKTSVLNYLITHHSEFNMTDNHWFVRLDVDKTVLEHYHQPFHIINSFVEKVCRVVDDNIETILSEQVKSKAKELHKYYIDSYRLENLSSEEQNEIHNLQKLKLRRLIELIRLDCGKKLIIFFDNIDILFYHTASISAEKEKETHDFITGLLEMFIHDRGHLGALGANLILVMRLDTYHYLKSFGKISGSLFTNDPYTIVEPPWNEVIDARYDLLRYIITKDDRFKDKDEVRLDINRIYEYFIKSEFAYEKLIDHIRKLTNNGLRELMEYFRNYGWISEVEQPTIQRFNVQTHVGLISFILNGRKLYTQINSLIPNIYLNCLIPHSYNSSNTVKYPNSYWLKYLVLQYAIHCNSLGEGISESQIFDIFSGTKYSFPLKLVKEVVEVLCDPSRFSMFRRTRTYIDAHQYDIQITPTEKAKHVFNEFRFKFFYLQLVVDDYLIGLPKVLQEECFNRVFDFTKQNIDYTYITYNVEKYSVESKRIVEVKAKLVMYFLQILKTSYKFESIVFADVFAKLSDLGVPKPDLDSVTNNIREELSTLNRSVNFSTSLEGFIKSAENECVTINNAMTDCYVDSINKRENSSTTKSN